jgi:hypothetical protein
LSIIQQTCSQVTFARWGPGTDEKTRCCSLWDNFYCLRERLRDVCLGHHKHLYEMTLNTLKQTAFSDGCFYYADRDYCKIFPVWAIILIVIFSLTFVAAILLLLFFKFCR